MEMQKHERAYTCNTSLLFHLGHGGTSDTCDPPGSLARLEPASSLHVVELEINLDRCYVRRQCVPHAKDLGLAMESNDTFHHCKFLFDCAIAVGEPAAWC